MRSKESLRRRWSQGMTTMVATDENPAPSGNLDKMTIKLGILAKRIPDITGGLADILPEPNLSCFMAIGNLSCHSPRSRL